MSDQHPRRPDLQPYSEKFLFVNYDSKRPSGSHDDQSRVLSHVRQNYHVWRRKQNVKHLRDPVVVPATCKQKVPIPSSQRRPLSESSRHVRGRPVPTARNGAIRTQRTGGVSEPAVGSPSINLHRGNSDPFNAYPVKIDPQVNELIAFYRDYLLPAQYHVPSTAWVSSANARLDWSICTSTLQEPASGNAFIARSATVAAVLNPALRTLAMRYRLRSIQELRSRLRDNVDQTYGDVNVLQIIMLQKADIVDKNLSAAAAHANILQNMFQEQQKRNHTVNFTLLQYALWSHTQISSMFMAPLAFDVNPGGWVVTTMRPLWDAALQQLRELPQWTYHRDNAERCLDPSVEGEELKAFFVSRRTTLQTWLLYGLSGRPTPPLIMLWLTTTACLQQGRMLKHYIRAVHEAKESASLSSREGGGGCSAAPVEYWYTQQYLILAEFLWTHHLSYKVEVGGIDLFDMVPTQLKNLRAALQNAEDAGPGPGPRHSSKYRNARLWALFIGAHAELLRSKSMQKTSSSELSSNKALLNKNHEKKETPSFVKYRNDAKYGGSEGYEETSDRWFETHFAHQLRDMELSEWKDVYSVLKGFNYADIIKPLGEEIFNNAMNVVQPPLSGIPLYIRSKQERSESDGSKV
ncbi:uncharacterized protein Z520_04954 [Fonsecaea multimorphosa CBS 102226]|uniref:Transcription factor domain-containing protein n=1 Tax=Fonsecaea multimorphosa CBS 102226 TaxID=1442371 RepID=A0A0D2KRR4_9EURO|nr:uncharacterized protein Z520_04954 [Fonsecaea multimorphosa CBS 102226]KIX99378.1 hypothetical protein Z520_04954 [Fonsecaea multimorphosa CBS 102226]OAL25706.1 hypothetical protein AYO22_04695 [Fonsecaea multimorphosa]